MNSNDKIDLSREVCILVVEEPSPEASVLSQIIGQVFAVSSLHPKDLNSTQTSLPNLLILDNKRSNPEQLRICKILNIHPQWERIPCLLVSEGDIQLESQALKLGMCDILRLPLHPSLVRARICSHIKRCQPSSIQQPIQHKTSEDQNHEHATQARIAISALLETSLEPLPLERQLDIALDIILFIPWLAVEFKGGIFLMNEQTQQLEMVAQRDLPEPLLTACAKISMGECLCGLAAQTRGLVFASEVDERHTITFNGMHPHGHYCVPIFYHNKLLGVLDLYLEHGHKRDPKEEALLTTIAHTLAGIIAHRQLEKTLEEERDFVSTVLETTSALVMVLDPEGGIVLFNQACERLTGYVAKTLENHRQIWDLLLDLDEVPTVRKHYDDLLKGGSLDRHEHVWLTQTGERRLISWVNSALSNPDGTFKNIVATGIDITEQRAAEKKLEHLAHNDALTGLPNRRMFHEYLNQALAHARRHRTRLAVLFMDLDRFKVVNDTMGHDVGDLLLIEASQRIRATLREVDIVARLGGDEFTVILGGDADQNSIASIAKKIIHSLCQPFHIGEHVCSIGSSIGISCHPEQGSDSEILLKQADMAMYQVKKAGRNHFLFYQPEMAVAQSRKV